MAAGEDLVRTIAHSVARWAVRGDNLPIGWMGRRRSSPWPMGSRVRIIVEQEVSHREDERIRRFGEAAHPRLSLDPKGQTH